MLPVAGWNGGGSEVVMETFLVRVWVPGDDRWCRTDLHGVVRHVASGVETPFCGEAEILDLLRPATAHPLTDLSL